MWYKLAVIISVEQFKELLKKDASSLNDIKSNYRSLTIKHHPDQNPNDQDAQENLRNLLEAYEPIRDKIDATRNPSPNSPPNPKPSPPPAPNTTVKDLTLDKADKLERLRPDQSPVDDFYADTDKRIEDKDIKLIGTKDDRDADCIIEEEVFIQNLLTKLTGYAQIYFKRKIFTISQDTYRGNTSRFSPAPLQRALGLTPPPGLLPTDPNTQVYDPASATGSPLGNFKRDRASITDPFGNPTAVMPVKDKTVVWNTADVQSIMSSLEKIAQMPELQAYGVKEITNILRYPLFQVKNSAGSVDRQIADKGLQLERYKPLLLRPDVPFGLTREDVVRIVDDLEREIDELRKAREDKKPDVEVVPFKEFYKLTELSRYFMYEGSQLNGVFCKLETKLITILNNTLNELGKMEKYKRVNDAYENARGKK